MGILPPAPQEGVVDVPAWKHFCELVAQGGGVCDYPGQEAEKQSPSDDSFFHLEVDRVDLHRRNLIPFLLEHCGLAGRSVLEFGAGTGGLSVAMARAGVGSVEAVEPVALNCEAGRARVRTYRLEGQIQFRHVPDTTQLPYPDGAFDAVVCSSVLQYVPDPGRRQALLTEMARVIRPGGLLIICATGNGLYPGGPHSSAWWSNLLPGRAARRGHNRGITFWEVRRVLAPLGFRAHPQGADALRRLRARVAHRFRSGPRRLALASALGSVRVAGTLLGLPTGAPLEAFLPFPDMAFRKGESRGEPVGEPPA